MTCTRKIGPYSCCTIVQGDCLELSARLDSRLGLAVVSDPPYGMDYDTNGERFTLGGRSLPRVYGDNKPFNPAPWLRFQWVVLWGFNHFPTLSPGGALVWLKRSDAAFGCFLSDCEIAWVKGIRGVYAFSNTTHAIACDREHPTQKPVDLMQFSIRKCAAPDAAAILDPFAGSGTTLVAAAKLGRHFLGFEISAEYCEIARKRLALVEAQPTLFEPKAEQTELEL